MPVKLFPVLRLLNNSVSVAHFHTMKPIPPIKSASRFSPIYSRIFPHKLWYQILGVPRLTHNRQFGVRRFSTRPSRIRSASGSEVRASKSLIEDEAELSDWVSGLRSDSFHKTRMHSDSDNEAESGGFEGRNKRIREDRGVKRGKRESYDDDYNVANRGRGNRDSFDSISRNSKGRRRFGGDLDRENGGFRTRGRRENGFRGGDLERENDGFRSRGRENDFRGGNDFSMGRKGGNAAFVNVRGHDTGRVGGGRDGGLGSGGKNMRRGGLMESGEDNVDDYADEFEEREKIVKVFSESISEEESEDEIEDEGDDDLFNKKGADSPIASSRSSSSGSDSYLSETRFTHTY